MQNKPEKLLNKYFIVILIGIMAKTYRKALQKKLSLDNINAVPSIDAVVVTMGIGSLVTRKGQKDFEELESNMRKITGQKPRVVKAKKSVSNFKLREGMPVMLQCTLRRDKAEDFLDRFVKLVLPRIRDFEGVKPRSFDKNGNITLGVKNYAIFPELGLDDVTVPMGIGITIVTTATSKEHSQVLLEELGYVFK